MQNLIPLPCILGPTGAGKSAAALSLAERLPVAVINADSRQVYKDFPLITARPSIEEQQTCPHLLYGFLDIREKLGAGEYARLAAQAVAEARAGNAWTNDFDVQSVRTPEDTGAAAAAFVPVLVGGTGLYVQALLNGIAGIPAVPEAVSRLWRERCETEGSPALHALLRERDPAYAVKIHPNDRLRITRALEVLEATGKSFSWWHAQPVLPAPYRAIKVGIALPLAELEPLLRRRIDDMLEKGALAEAEAALSRCDDETAPGWSGIGCAELYGYLTGTYTLEECRSLWLRNTRAYAKRQLTWFRADKDIRWFRPEQAEEATAFIVRELELDRSKKR